MANRVGHRNRYHVVNFRAEALVGLAVVELGGGRVRAADPIDYAVGLDMLAGRGMRVDAEQPIARIHAASEQDADRAEARLRTAYQVSETPSQDLPLEKGRIG